MNASSPTERDVSRVKRKVRWLTLGLITRMSIICCRKGDHTGGNSPDLLYSIRNNQQMQLYAVNFIPLLSSLYMFRAAHTPIIRSTTVSTATGKIIGWRRLSRLLVPEGAFTLGNK